MKRREVVKKAGREERENGGEYRYAGEVKQNRNEGGCFEGIKARYEKNLFSFFLEFFSRRATNSSRPVFIRLLLVKS